MNPAERRIIHSALQEVPEVETSSEGVEPNRYIVISPKGFKKSENDFKPARSENRDFNRNREGFKDRPRDFKRPEGQAPAFANAQRPPKPEGAPSPAFGSAQRPQGERPPFKERTDRPPFKENSERPPFREKTDRPPFKDKTERPAQNVAGQPMNAVKPPFNRDRTDRRENDFKDKRDNADKGKANERKESVAPTPPKKEFSLGFGSFLGNTRSLSNIERRPKGDNGYTEPLEPLEDETKE